MAAIDYGYTDSASVEPIGPKFLRITDIKDGSVDWTSVPYCGAAASDRSKYQLQTGDIVFARTGATTGKSYLIVNPPESVFASYLIRVRIKSCELEPEYLWYFFQTPTYWETINSGLTGSAQGGFNATKLGALQIPIPELPEQQRIVAILDEAFAAIATAKANAEKNLQNARAFIQSAFKTTLSRKGDDWSETTIGQQIHLQRGFDITKEQQEPGTVPVVSSGGIKSFHSTAMVEAPGVVIGRKGTLGKVFYLTEDYWPHDTTLWVKEFKNNDPRFVYHFLSALDVSGLNSGSANPALNRNQVHPIPVLWPPIEHQGELAARLDSICAETQLLESIYRRKLAALDELKKSLLHRAFNGDL